MKREIITFKKCYNDFIKTLNDKE